MTDLDRSKPFGEVHGKSAYAFEQNNKLFSSQGKEVDKNGKLVDTPKETETPKSDPRADLVEKLEAHTVPQLKEILTTLEVTFDKKATKADLIAMVADEELAS